MLKHLQSTLNHGHVDAIYAELDRFWAKLAVHVRAEHLHLFPTVLHGLTEPAAVALSVPTLAEARINIERLRADHDFLMRQLSTEVEAIRDLINTRETILENGLSAVRTTILDIEQRLEHHNQIEESGILSLGGNRFEYIGPSRTYEADEQRARKPSAEICGKRMVSQQASWGLSMLRRETF